jgi:hypothetical protein
MRGERRDARTGWVVIRGDLSQSGLPTETKFSEELRP